MAPTVELNIKNHCIEAEAKRVLKNLMYDYFDMENGKAKEIEELIMLLGRFIEEANFPQLRSSDKRLSGEIESTVIIKEDGNNIKLEIK